MYNKIGHLVLNWLAPFADPRRAIKGVAGYLRYFSDWRRYTRLPQAEVIRLVDTYPQIHDRSVVTLIDAHYFHVNGWAMRRIVATRPRFHVDIASQVVFANLLAAVVPVVYVDYRPLQINLDGLNCIGGNLLALPFADSEIISLSCLHVIEHIGLGRYGDPLDPQGTQKAAKELTRVLAPGGNLLLAIPVGRPRLCFNAHRIHAAESICEMVPDLKLVEFSGIHDDGSYVEHIGFQKFEGSEYACGLYWFQKPE